MCKNLFLLIVLFIYFINCIYGYVIREEVNGNICNIDFDKYNIIVKLDKDICIHPKFSSYDTFKFNNCELFKKEIKKGVEMWSKNNDKLKIYFNITDEIIKNKAKQNINVNIKWDSINGNTVAHAIRNCNRKLDGGSIILNKQKCFYPENFMCLYNNSVIILLSFVILLFHMFSFILIDILCKFNHYYINLLYIIPCFIIDVCIIIYINVNCNKCNFLKNVIAHEFGHILDFGHPDQNYYLNWDGFIQNCIIKKQINTNYDTKSIMNSLSNNIRSLETISSNDKLGLYDLYPSCNYVNDVYNNFEYWNKNNYYMNMLFLFYIMLSIVLIIIIKTIFYIQYEYEDNTVYDYDRESDISEEIELQRY